MKCLFVILVLVRNFRLFFIKMEQINKNLKKIVKKLDLVDRKLGVINITMMTLDEKVSLLEAKIDEKCPNKENDSEVEEVEPEAGPSSFNCHICGHGPLLYKSERIHKIETACI